MVHCLRKRKSGAILIFKSICGSKANNLGKCLILFATVLFIVEEH